MNRVGPLSHSKWRYTSELVGVFTDVGADHAFSAVCDISSSTRYTDAGRFLERMGGGKNPPSGREEKSIADDCSAGSGNVAFD